MYEVEERERNRKYGRFSVVKMEDETKRDVIGKSCISLLSFFVQSKSLRAERHTSIVKHFIVQKVRQGGLL